MKKLFIAAFCLSALMLVVINHFCRTECQSSLAATNLVFKTTDFVYVLAA